MRLGALTAALLVTASTAWPAAAPHPASQSKSSQPALPKGEMLLRADQVDYDQNNDVATASGHVEIDYDQQILLADKATYSKATDTVTATGHVVLLQPNGDVMFANHVVLTDQMRDGFVEALSARLGPTGRLVAASGQRIGGTRMIAHKAVYTPCKICDQPGQRTPEWAAKADRVVYDQTTHRISYNDTTVDAFGIPVLWTPYFSHADPTVKRASGILTPEIGDSSSLGYYTRIPIYVSLTDSQDFTIAPFLTTHSGEVLEGEYRQLWQNGGMWLQPAVAYNPHGGDTGTQPQTYSTIFGAGLLQLNTVWQTGYRLQLTSNETWLELYKISQAQRLVNDLYLEGISGRSRFVITGYFFQGLLASDVNKDFPVVLPLIDYSYIPSDGRLLGGDFEFDLNTAAVARQVGESDQRATAEVNWKMPAMSSSGQLFTLDFDTRGDIYHLADAPDTLILPGTAEPPSVPTTKTIITRGIPTAALDWRWPFVTSSPSRNISYLIEPIAQLIMSPYGGNPAGIPNEDSSDFQFDDTNIFSFDRFPGYDLVETGPRSNVGFRAQTILPSGSVELLVGQEFRLKPDPIFASDSGISGRRSDVVSSLTVNFLPHYAVTERVDVDSSTGTLERNEVYVDAYYGRSSLEVSYLKVPEEEVTLGLPTREEVNAQALISLFSNWLVYAAGQRNLATGTMIADEFGFGYDDECIGLSISYRREYTADRNVPPSTDVLVRFNLKTTEEPEGKTTLFPQHLYSHIPL